MSEPFWDGDLAPVGSAEYSSDIRPKVGDPARISTAASENRSRGLRAAAWLSKRRDQKVQPAKNALAHRQRVIVLHKMHISSCSRSAFSLKTLEENPRKSTPNRLDKFHFAGTCISYRSPIRPLLICSHQHRVTGKRLKRAPEFRYPRTLRPL